VHWKARAEPAAIFSVLESEGELESNGEHAITVSGAATRGVLTPGLRVSGALTLTLEGTVSKEIVVPLSLEPQGAQLSIPMGLDFGLVSLASPDVRASLHLTNTGTEPATVRFVAENVPPAFVIASAPEARVDANSDVAFDFGLRARESGDLRAALRVETEGPICNLIPDRVPLVATITGKPIAMQPGTVDFGETACGASPSAQNVVIHNYGAQTVTWSATVAAGADSPFTITSASTGSIDPDKEASISISAQSLTAPGAFFDTLKLAIGADVFDVPLTQRKLGALLSIIGGNALSAGRKKLGSSTAIGVELVNSGNAPFTFQPALTGDSDFSNAGPSSITVLPGAATSIPLSFSVQTTLDRAATLDLASDQTVCGTVPSVAITGRGYARAKSVWGYTGVVLDDGQSLFDLYRTSVLATLTPGAVALREPLDSQACYLPPNTNVPRCFTGSSFEDKPARAGVRSLVNGAYALFDDGTVMDTQTGAFVSGLTNVTRLESSGWTTCALRNDHSVECWGGGLVIKTLSGSDMIASDARFVIPGLQAADIAIAHSYDGGLCAARLDGRVQCWDEMGLTGSKGVVLAAPTDAVRLFTHANGLLAITASKLAYEGQQFDAFSVLPLTDVVDFGSGKFLLEDGRVFDAVGDFPLGVTAEPGFE
jgi:hypothetical protein